MKEKHDIKALLALKPEELTPERAKEVDGIMLHGILDIQVQLGDRGRTDKDGNKLTGSQWGKWRTRALTAMNAMIEWRRQHKEIRRAVYVREA